MDCKIRHSGGKQNVSRIEYLTIDLRLSVVIKLGTVDRGNIGMDGTGVQHRCRLSCKTNVGLITLEGKSPLTRDFKI